METQTVLDNVHRISTKQGILLVLMITVAIIAATGHSPVTTETWSVPANATVMSGDRTEVGVANDQDQMNFGRIAVGMDSRKSLTVTNQHPTAHVSLQTTGNISEHVSIPKNNIRMAAGDTKQFTLVFTGKQKGHYTGEITVTKQTLTLPVIGLTMPWPP